MSIIIRHGDVGLRRLPGPPEGVKRAKDNVLAYGEATGHRHEITEGEVYAAEDGTLYVYVPEEGGEISHMKGAQVVEEEHGVLPVEGGWWEYLPQRQDTPEGWERVRD